MELLIRDFNGSEGVIGGVASKEWMEIEQALRTMPLHLKPSDQRGKQGEPIFDPVGTNQAIKSGLIGQDRRWEPRRRMPPQASWLGLDIDHGKGRVLVEAQFSNYPFLLNNLMRLELVRRMQLEVLDTPGVDLGIIITKGKMFPASNSTLYHEQAVSFVTEMARLDMFRLPVRLVGLVVEPGDCVPCVFTDAGARYSRDISSAREGTCCFVAGRGDRYKITMNE